MKRTFYNDNKKRKLPQTDFEPQEPNNKFAKWIVNRKLFKKMKNVLKKLKKFFLTSQTKNKPIKEKKEYRDPQEEGMAETLNTLTTLHSAAVAFLLLVICLSPFWYWSNVWVPPLGDFLCLWSFPQWIVFLTALIFYSWISRFCYNKWLSDTGGWIDSKKWIGLLLGTLAVHSGLGVVMMQYRDTLLWTFMFANPVTTLYSIFILLLVCFYVYHRFYK